MEELGDNEINLFKDNRLRLATVALLFLGIFVLALGAGIYFFENNRGEDIKIISGASEATVSVGELVVHVDGSVVNPGVYKLPSGSRVSDVIEKAGGLSEEADKNKVNLAAKLTDGQKVYLFAKGEQITSEKGQAISQSAKLININTATAGQLDTLPGIGTVTAGKIISGRPYSDINELSVNKVVSASVFEKIKDLISAN